MTLAHRVDGSGPPLVLLNGIAMTLAGWEPIARPLAENHQVIRCDFRGQLMTPGPAPVRVDAHGDDVLELLDHLGIDSAHLVSTSFGGAVGAIVAGRAPDRVRSLVSIASADGFTASMAEEIARWRQACVDVLDGAPGRRVGEVLEPVVYSEAYLRNHRRERAAAMGAMDALPRAWFEGLIGLLDSAGGFALGDTLESIRCPTLILAAEEDGFIPLQRCRALAEAIRGAEFEVLPGAGHAVVAENPPMVVERVRPFLEGPAGAA